MILHAILSFGFLCIMIFLAALFMEMYHQTPNWLKMLGGMSILGIFLDFIAIGFYVIWGF